MSDVIPFPEERPTRADAAKNHELLLQTASRLFAQDGVEHVSMSAIAQEAGVGKGTLYRHFANKSDICHALIDCEMQQLQERTLGYLRQSTDPAASLHWFVTQIVGFVMDNITLLCEASNHAAVSLLQHPAHLWWRQTIHGLLTQSQFTGDIDYMADMLYIMLDVQTLWFQRQTLGYDGDRIVAGICATLDHILS